MMVTSMTLFALSEPCASILTGEVETRINVLRETAAHAGHHHKDDRDCKRDNKCCKKGPTATGPTRPYWTHRNHWSCASPILRTFFYTKTTRLIPDGSNIVFDFSMGSVVTSDQSISPLGGITLTIPGIYLARYAYQVNPGPNPPVTGPFGRAQLYTGNLAQAGSDTTANVFNHNAAQSIIFFVTTVPKTIYINNVNGADFYVGSFEDGETCAHITIGLIKSPSINVNA